MLSDLGFRTVDLGMVVVANAIHVLMMGIFLSRVPAWRRLERNLGWIFVGMALPVTVAIVLNLLGRREWWTYTLPSILLLFIAVEFVLDFWLEMDFRHTRLLGPYLLLYYLSLMMMIGYAFLVDEVAGFVTLATYFLQLGATAFSYRRVGHGAGKREEVDEKAEGQADK